MRLYNNFVGIDIGKLTFVVAVHGQSKTEEFENTAMGIDSFIKKYETVLKESLSVLETTGGYETKLMLTLVDIGYAVHRANTRKVKHFIYSLGNGAKTDRLDAKALALYGYERRERLECFVPPSKRSLELFELTQRRQDLKRFLVAEKNRLQAPRCSIIKSSCEKVIEVISGQIEEVTKQIQDLIAEDVILSNKKKILKAIPGVGEITANDLLILLPELGNLNRREIASLAGLAPRANDSGLHKGYRVVAHGRSDIKSILFMSAMAARNSNSSLKEFYNRLVAAGKKKMVALTALMRKIIVMANAKIRDWNQTQVIANNTST